MYVCARHEWSCMCVLVASILFLLLHCLNKRESSRYQMKSCPSFLFCIDIILPTITSTRTIKDMTISAIFKAIAHGSLCRSEKNVTKT